MFSKVSLESGGVVGWRMRCFGQHGEPSPSLPTSWVYEDVGFCGFVVVEHMNDVNAPNPFDCNHLCECKSSELPCIKCVVNLSISEVTDF